MEEQRQKFLAQESGRNQAEQQQEQRNQANNVNPNPNINIFHNGDDSVQ
jgi:hypothetical protein